MKVVAPASPADAFGMLKTAIRDDDPVLFCENLVMYNVTGPVPDDPEFTVPLGKAAVVREGRDLTIVAHSYTVQRALRVADHLALDGVEAEVVDLRSLRPLDIDTVAESVRKTNRALVAEEGWSTYGVGAELAARIHRICFDDLDAPVERVGQAEVPMPYSKPLELAALPLESKIEAAARGLLRDCGCAMTDELVMPRLSDTMEEGTIGRWLKAEGDEIHEGEVIAEIETDKATMEFQAYSDGTLLKILVSDGETAPLGSPIAIVGEPGESVPEDAAAAPKQKEKKAREPERAPAEQAPAAPPPAPAVVAGNGSGGGALKVSPIARRMADEAGLDLSALAGTGSGPEGRIVKADVERMLAGSGSAVAAPVAPAPSTPASAAPPPQRWSPRRRCAS